MEELFARLRCDFCKKHENQSLKYCVEPYLNWHRVKVKGGNAVVNLCSDECLENYVKGILNV